MKDALLRGIKNKELVKWGRAAGVLLVLVFLMMWLSGAFLEKVEPGSPQERGAPPALSTQKVKKQTYPLVIEQVGTVRAHAEAQVSSRIMAQVKEIRVREGEDVTGPEGKDGGTVMAHLDDRDIQARLRQAEPQVTALDRAREAAEARLASARAQAKAARANRSSTLSDYRRYEDLKKNRAATGQQLEHAGAQLSMAEARLQSALKDVDGAQSEIKRIQAQKEQAEAVVAEARALLTHTVIRAPFTGRVIRKMVDAGDMATPGQPLFLMETSSRPELHAFVSESFLKRLKVGQTLEVSIDAVGRGFDGTLREVVPQSDPSTRTVLVKVSLPPDSDLVNGLFGRLRVVYGEYEALVAPFAAVREVGQLHLVDVVDGDGHPQRRFVTLGARHADLVEILSGLKENEEVVIP
jgi:multidrug efflux pump subunit AcrA (membrane-fusion protein)